MHSIALSFNVNIQDLMSYPEMRRALQEREQRYLSNMEWLDKDLHRRIKEEEEKERLHQEKIAWLDEDLNRLVELKVEEDRVTAATIIQKYARRMITPPYEFQESKRPASSPPILESTTQSTDIQDTRVDEIHFTLQKTKNSLYGNGGDDWKVKEDKVLKYLEDSIKDGKWDTKWFLTYLYTDEDYCKWSKEREDEGIKFRKNYTTGEHVIGMGDKFKNWKKQDGEWICDSFHFIKQVYDTMKQRQKKGLA